MVKSSSELPVLPAKVRKILTEILEIPTSPFNEQFLFHKLMERFKNRTAFSVKTDKAGNILVNYLGRNKRPKICFHAHLDHPGFEFIRSIDEKVGIAEALGGVPENCRGAYLQFFSGRNAHSKKRCRIKRFYKRGRAKFVEIENIEGLMPGDIGMWPFLPLSQKGMWVSGRAFDDNLGVGILVNLLETAAKRRVARAFQVLFTRAEECGYVSALEMVRLRTLRPVETIITIEMPRSSDRVFAGEGVMLRAGDRNMDFEPYTSLVIAGHAKKLAASKNWFRWQRALGLFGGTECTVFQLYGHKVGALCLAVENAHNAHKKNGRPSAEKVHRRDLLSLIHLIDSIVSEEWNVESAAKNLKKKINKQVNHLKPRLTKNKSL